MSTAALLFTTSSAPAQSTDSALVVEQLGYRTTAGKSLLAAVSMRLQPGRLVAVLGPNGAGKTTLLRLLASELPPTSGKILLEDRPLIRWSASERARRIAVLPQQSTLTAALTSLEVALLGRSAHSAGDHPSTDLEIAHDALALLNAVQLAPRLYPSLSGGEKSRVQAARALAQVQVQCPPAESLAIPPPFARFLLLDEPTAALDCAHQHQLLSRMREVARTQNIGVLAILHDLNLAAHYADELLVLKGGQTVARGPTRDVFQADMLSAAFSFPMLVIPHPLHGWPMAIPK